MPALLRKAVEAASLPEKVAEDAAQAVLAERSAMHETLFGAINGLTNTAQALPPDQRYDLEAMAGHLLEANFPGSASGRRRAMLS